MTTMIEEMHISSAQIEVWEMKEKIYESVKELSLKEGLIKILSNSMELTNKFLNETHSKFRDK